MVARSHRMRSCIIRAAKLDGCMECEVEMMSLVDEHQVILAASALTLERSRPFISKTWQFIEGEHLHYIYSAHTQQNASRNTNRQVG